MSLRLRSSARRYSRTAVIIILGILAWTPLLLADEPVQPPREHDLPTVQADLNTSSESQVNTSSPRAVADSLDFLGQNSSITAPDLLTQTTSSSGEVAFLVAEECSQETEGITFCQRTYSNGHRATVRTQTVNEGDELKRQTIIEESESDGTLLYRKTIRYRLDYNYHQDQKRKEKELFDITYQPVGKAATRELMVYEFSLEREKPRSLSWTQYKQTDKKGWASLTFHTLLRYGEDGKPERAIAEAWHNGKKAETFMDWNRRATGYALWDKDSWTQWEGWIRNVSLQAYLP